MVTVWINASARYRKFPRRPSEVPDHIIHEPLELLQVLDRLETSMQPAAISWRLQA